MESLPEAPDATFVAVPREAAVDTVARLAAMGAGGVRAIGLHVEEIRDVADFGAAPPIGAGCAFGTEAEAGDRVEAEAGAAAGAGVGIRAGAGAEAEAGVGAAVRLAGTGSVVTSVDEHRAKRWLHGVGIPVPAGSGTWSRDGGLSQRLCRYIARPTLSNERLSVNDRGQVVYRLKPPFRDGTTHVVLDPTDFVVRLAALAHKSMQE